VFSWEGGGGKGENKSYDHDTSVRNQGSSLRKRGQGLPNKFLEKECAFPHTYNRVRRSSGLAADEVSSLKTAHKRKGSKLVLTSFKPFLSLIYSCPCFTQIFCLFFHSLCLSLVSLKYSCLFFHSFIPASSCVHLSFPSYMVLPFLSATHLILPFFYLILHFLSIFSSCLFFDSFSLLVLSFFT
jgi:hypothetical protein